MGSLFRRILQLRSGIMASGGEGMNRSTAAPSPEDFIRAIVKEVERRISQGGRLEGGDFPLAENTTPCPLTEPHG